MRKTKQDYEAYLNPQVIDSDRLLNEYAYLYSRERQSTKEKATIKCLLKKGRLGTTLRRYDPIAFECGFEDWQPSTTAS
jgi:hypothetical protein